MSRFCDCFRITLKQHLDKIGSDDDGDALCANQPECSHQVEEEQVEAKAGLERESVFFSGLGVKMKSFSILKCNIPERNQSEI